MYIRFLLYEKIATYLEMDMEWNKFINQALILNHSD